MVTNCVGTLISPNYVLTAGHCIFKREPGKYEVKVGKRTPNEKLEQSYKVVEAIAHPDFVIENPLPKFDFGLLKLASPVPNMNYIVCLPADDSQQFVGANVTVSGWGRIIPNLSSISTVLQTATLSIIEDSICKKGYGTFFPWHMCASGALTNSSTCMGDSGGTFQYFIQLFGTIKYFLPFLDQNNFCLNMLLFKPNWFDHFNVTTRSTFALIFIVSYRKLNKG